MSIVSFDLEGDFAAFRDPSVTTNQTVTVIPSKSAVIGLIGALLGIQRSDSIFDDIYSRDLPACVERDSVHFYRSNRQDLPSSRKTVGAARYLAGRGQARDYRPGKGPVRRAGNLHEQPSGKL